MSTGCIVALSLCVVVALPVLLSAMGERLARQSRGDLHAKAQMQGLVLAVKAYQTEYSRLPALESPPPTEDNTQGYDTASESGRGIIKVLTGEDESKNPRKIPFYEPPAERKSGAGYSPEKGLADIWGTKGYIMILDYDGNGEISDLEHPGVIISASVIIYSAGSDGDYNTWDDNIKSWE
jgi:hypothetical protein